MKETKLATVETKIVKEIVGVEKYAVVGLAAEISEDRETILYYEPKIKRVYESKDDAIKYIQDSNNYGAFIVPMTQILKKEQYVQN